MARRRRSTKKRSFKRRRIGGISGAASSALAAIGGGVAAQLATKFLGSSLTFIPANFIGLVPAAAGWWLAGSGGDAKKMFGVGMLAVGATNVIRANAGGALGRSLPGYNSMQNPRGAIAGPHRMAMRKIAGMPTRAAAILSS
jgi:hypothetical protein